MIAETYYEKALANLKVAKITYQVARDDEEQLNIIGYHLQQALELAIKHVFLSEGIQINKTHNIDQLIMHAKTNNLDLMLPEYLIEQSEAISSWESKTRYILGYTLELRKIEKAMANIEDYFSILVKHYSN